MALLCVNYHQDAYIKLTYLLSNYIYIIMTLSKSEIEEQKYEEKLLSEEEKAHFK